MKKFLIGLIVAFITSCNISEEAAIFKSPNSKKEIKHTTLESQIVKLDSSFFSIATELHIYGDKMICIDKMYCYAYIYDTLGKYIGRKLGTGHSNKEISGSEITIFGVNSNGTYVVFSDVQAIIFDSTFTKISSFIMPTKVRDTPNSEVYGQNPMIYSWSWRNRLIRSNHDKIFMTVDMRRINYIEDKKRYFNEGRTIMCIEPSTGIPEHVFARYSDRYKNSNMQSFYMSTFDIDDDGNFYVSLEADSLIYQYDKDFKQTNTFGNAGNNMRTDYVSIDLADKLNDIIDNERKLKGFYEQVEYIQERNTLLRLYRRGSADEHNDGLQLYENNTLIADIDIPKGYKIAGYSEPFIYLFLMNEMAEQMDIIKLRY